MSKTNEYSALTPPEIAAKIAAGGVTKAGLPLGPQLLLGLLAGSFIGLGSLYFALITSDPTLGFAAGKILGGSAFAMGLILVVVGGAELFTGNHLLTMAWAGGKLSPATVLRNWVIICLANFVGAAGLALLVVLSGHPQMNNGLIAEHYLKIADAKCQLPFMTAFFRGVLCNFLVCLAIWLATAGRNVIDKAVAILLPISAFVAAGFEHSVANMYFLPMGIFLKMSGEYGIPADAVSWLGFLHNIVPVILGNIVGGGVLIGLVYYLIYLRKERS